MPFNSTPSFFNRAVYCKVLMMQKLNLAAVGFEPTPPKRLVPKTSALDHSATLPDVLNFGPKHFKSRGDYYISVLPGPRNQVVVGPRQFKVKTRSVWLPARKTLRMQS